MRLRAGCGSTARRTRTTSHPRGSRSTSAAKVSSRDEAEASRDSVFTVKATMPGSSGHCCCRRQKGAHHRPRPTSVTTTKRASRLAKPAHLPPRAPARRARRGLRCTHCHACPWSVGRESDVRPLRTASREKARNLYRHHGFVVVLLLADLPLQRGDLARDRKLLLLERLTTSPPLT